MTTEVSPASDEDGSTAASTVAIIIIVVILVLIIVIAVVITLIIKKERKAAKGDKPQDYNAAPDTERAATDAQAPAGAIDNQDAIDNKDIELQTKNGENQPKLIYNNNNEKAAEEMEFENKDPAQPAAGVNLAMMAKIKARLN